jgi:hypothetical protein
VIFYPEHGTTNHLATIDQLRLSPIYQNIASILQAYETAGIVVDVKGFEVETNLRAKRRSPRI